VTGDSPFHPDDEATARLARYVTGGASPEEALEVERWIAADPARRALVDQLMEVWRRSGEGPDPMRLAEFDLDRARLKVKQKIRWGAPLAKPSALSGSRYLPRFAAAAAVALLAAGSWWAVQTVSLRMELGSERLAEYWTDAGEVRTVVLSDGSQATLAPGSALRETRSGATREVELRGQAYFAVSHDPARPFIVRAGGIETRVLGTQFSVKSRPGEPAGVVLRSGKVAVTAGSPSRTVRAVLSPGQHAMQTPDGSLRVTRVDLARELAWTTGRLDLAGTPVGDVARDLEHWFGLPIVLSDSALQRRRITGSFPLDSSTTVIRALAALLDARVEQRGDTVVFTRRTES
jgi:transmembrane sensor